MFQNPKEIKNSFISARYTGNGQNCQQKYFIGDKTPLPRINTFSPTRGAENPIHGVGGLHVAGPMDSDLLAHPGSTSVLTFFRKSTTFDQIRFPHRPSDFPGKTNAATPPHPV